MTRPVALVAAIVAALSLSPVPAGAGEPSVDKSATIGVPGLPPKGAGLKDLNLVFGKDPGQALRAPIEAELRDLEAFREFLPERGDIRLDVQILAVRRNERQFGGTEGETPDQFEVSVESLSTWTWGETTQLQVPLNLSRRIDVDGHPRRSELESMLTALLRETGQRAFAELYEKYFHRRSR